MARHLPHAVLAILAAIVVQYLFLAEPIAFARLVTEDDLGENASALAFALGGAIALVAGVKRRARVPIVLGILALLVGAEEMSWGQRILGVGTPGLFRELNVQGELTLHNIQGLDRVSRAHTALGLVVLAWCVVSLGLPRLAPNLHGRLAGAGWPLASAWTLPLGLLFAFYAIVTPVAKADEVGELFLGLMVLAWALEHTRVRRRAAAMASALVLVALGALFLADRFPGLTSSRLHALATRDYPRLGLYEQSEAIFEHIYRTPGLERPFTRSTHEALRVARTEISGGGAAGDGER